MDFAALIRAEHDELINHGFLHLGEMLAIRGRLGLKGF